MEVILFLILFYLFFHNDFGQRNNENNNVHLHHLHFFCRYTELMYQTFLKAVSKIETCFGQRRWKAASFCSFLSKEKLQFLDSIIKKITAPLRITAFCQWWQKLPALKCPWAKSWSAIVKVMILLSPFNQWEFFIFVETGNSLFSKNVCSPFIYLSPHPPLS